MDEISTTKVKDIVVAGRDVCEHVGLMLAYQSFAGRFLILLPQSASANFKYVDWSIEAERNAMSELCPLVPVADEFGPLIVGEYGVRVHIFGLIALHLDVDWEYFL